MWRGALPALWAAVKDNRRAVVLGLVAPLALGATCFLLVPAGLAAAGDLLAAWIRGWWPVGGDYSTWEILRRLLLSEPLLLGFGLAGLVGALRRRDRFGRWAAVAAGIALLVPLVGRGRHPADLALVVLPLTFLAGPAIARVSAPGASMACSARCVAAHRAQRRTADFGGHLPPQRMEPRQHR